MQAHDLTRTLQLFIPMGVTFALASSNWERIPHRLHATIIPFGLVVGAATMVALGMTLRNGADFGLLPLVVFVGGAGSDHRDANHGGDDRV